MERYDVIVAGVGGMGSATVMELAARGARVLGLERAGIPNSTGSSHGVNRIIRLAYAEDPRYVPMLRRAYERWRDLEKAAGEQLLYVTGGVDAGLPDSQTVRGSLESIRQHDLPHEVLSAAELHQRFPGYRLPDEMQAVYQPDAGFVASERAIVAHVRQALRHGAEIHGEEPVVKWSADGTGVKVRTAKATYHAKQMVIAAGAWIGKFVPQYAPHFVPERQVLMWSQPKRPDAFALGNFPIFVLEGPAARYYGFPEFGIPGFKIGRYHHLGETVDPDEFDRDAFGARDEAVLREGIQSYFPDADGPTLSLASCMFTNTRDEHFVIDRLSGVPQIILASPCSGHGYKFASVIGEIVADLALEGGSRFDLSMFSLARLLEPAAASA
ncbi:MAG: sarcosine oxidase [Chloroflexota bacterium]|jgi:sarcosine oxidase|nr:sarcosine oxidase [Chloroflexota bacterium]